MQAVDSRDTLAKVDALYQGFSSEHIELCDALQPENVPECSGQQLRFDVIVCHPPWGVKEWRDERPVAERHDRFRRGMPPKNNADYAYLLHMVSSLKEDTGRMAAVVAGGVLSRGAQEARIRQRLLEDNLVDSVIALPDKMFQGTPVGGAILVMRRDRKVSNVLFVDARQLSHAVSGKNTFSDEALERIRHACAARTDDPGLSAVASFQEIAANAYSLSVSLYVRIEQESSSTDMRAIRSRREKLRNELGRVTHRIDAIVTAINSTEPSPLPPQPQA
jgi:type I restriction enzyme M protein